MEAKPKRLIRTVTPLEVVNKIKTIMELSRAQISRDTGISDYRLERLFNHGDFGKNLIYLIPVCDKSFDMHVCEVFRCTMSKKSTTVTEMVTHHVNGYKETRHVNNEKAVFKDNLHGQRFMAERAARKEKAARKERAAVRAEDKERVIAARALNNVI